MNDTQAEDRQAQIQARLQAFQRDPDKWTVEELLAGFREDYHCTSDAELFANAPFDIEWLLDELSRIRSVGEACGAQADEWAAKYRDAKQEIARLSRVEQALREVLTFFADEAVLDAVDDDKMSGIRPCPPATCMCIRDVRRWYKALSASPEAQPKGGAMSDVQHSCIYGTPKRICSACRAGLPLPSPAGEGAQETCPSVTLSGPCTCPDARHVVAPPERAALVERLLIQAEQLAREVLISRQNVGNVMRQTALGVSAAAAALRGETGE